MHSPRFQKWIVLLVIILGGSFALESNVAIAQDNSQNNLFGMSAQQLANEVGNTTNSITTNKAMSPYDAAKARYDRIMANRPSIQRSSISCLPMWCKRFNSGSSNPAVKTARKVAERIESSHKGLLQTRIQNQSQSEEARIKQAQQQREEFFKKIQQKSQDFQSSTGL